jgi:hypothetical protein
MTLTLLKLLSIGDPLKLPKSNVKITKKRTITSLEIIYIVLITYNKLIQQPHILNCISNNTSLLLTIKGLTIHTRRGYTTRNGL